MVSRKRFGALLLLLALMVPILAACGGGGTTTAPTAAPAAAAPTAAPAAEAATAAPAADAPTAMADAPTAMADAPTAMAEAGGAIAGATAGASGDVSKIQVEEGATLRVSSWGDPSEQKVNTDSFARFNKIFPNVTINYEPQPADFQTKMKADFAGNTEPDVFYVDSSLMTAFGPSSLLLPIDDAMQTAGVTTDDYIGTLTQLFVLDGKTYGLPKDQGSLALFVNNDIAQQAGVDPASLKTWDDVTAAAKKMTSGEGPGKVFGMCLSSEIQRIGALMLASNNPIVQDKKATFNQESGVAAVDFWYNFKKDGSGDLFKEQGAGWCGEAFSKKTSAMVVEGGWMIPFMEQQGPDVKYTALPLPTPPGGKQATLVYTNAWGASARTKYPNAAAALVLFLTSAANQQPILQTGFALPTVKSLLNDPYFSQNPNAKVLAEAAQYGSVADLTFGPPATYNEVAKAINEGLEALFLGTSDTKSALDQSAQQVDQLLSQ
jgi:multiple sugar transport system substrate-binding protein